MSDSGAEQRRGPGKIEVGGDTQDERFIDDDAVGVSAVGDAPEVFVRGAVGLDLVWAELFKASLAMGAGVVGVDQAADRAEKACRVCRPSIRNREYQLAWCSFRVDQRSISFMCSSESRAPCTAVFASALWISRRSADVSSTSAAPMFSPMRSSFRVPGIGTIHGFWASSQASAI